jgi:dihydrofolate reductase
MYRAYLAISADGKIADSQGGVGWLERFDGVQIGFDEFLNSQRAIVMGRTTYDQVLTFGKWPYEGKDVVVVTSRPLGGAPERVSAYSGVLSDIPNVLPRDGDIWVLGGGKLVTAMLAAGLVDRLELFVMPLVLGGGVPLITPDAGDIELDLVGSQTHDLGIVELVYAPRR